MLRVHPTARKTSARDAHARKRLFVRTVRGDAHTRTPHSRQTDQVCLQNANPHIFSKTHTYISVHARHTSSPARQTLCTSAHRCKDNAKTTSTHHERAKRRRPGGRERINKRPNPTTENKAKTHTLTHKARQQQHSQARTDANTARNNSGQRHNGLRRQQQQPPVTSSQAVNHQTRPKASRWHGNNVRAAPRQPSPQGRGQTRSAMTRPARKRTKKGGTRNKQQRETHQTNQTPAPGNSKSTHKNKPVAKRISQLHRWASSGALVKHTAVQLFHQEKPTVCLFPLVSTGELSLL